MIPDKNWYLMPLDDFLLLDDDPLLDLGQQIGAGQVVGRIQTRSDDGGLPGQLVGGWTRQRMNARANLDN